MGFGSRAADERARPAPRRQRIAIAVAVVSVVLAVGGVAASTLIQSPAKVAAETDPPAPDTLSAKAVEQVLAQTVVLRGSFSPGRVYSIAPSSVAATKGNPGAPNLVVTKDNVTSGQLVSSGDVLAEVSGRPVFVLKGIFPAYRDMIAGESGPDIAELQAALEGLGFWCGGDPSGVFGDGTVQAVKQFYSAIGYAVPIANNGSADSSSLDVVHDGGKGSSPSDAPSPSPSPDQPASPGPSPSAAQGSKPGSTAPSAQPAVMVPMSEAWFLPSLPPVSSAPSRRWERNRMEPC